MEWWQAIILGLVEGITEYLPVSSTGHLILTSSLLGLDDTPQREAAVNAFNIVIQGGAILAVLGLYWPRIWQMLRGLAGRDPKGFRLFVNLIVAFVPAAILGFLFDDAIEELLFGPWPVIAALAVGGVLMIVVDRVKVRPMRIGTGGEDLDALTPGKALVVGLLQCVAMWPGTSRSMMTIVGGVLVGLRPKAAAEFSFLLGLPTLTGACVLKLAKNILDSREAGTPNLFEELGWVNVAIGLAVATVSAVLAVRWLVGFLNRHGLAAFGWYRLGLCAVLGALVLAGIVTFPEPREGADPAVDTPPTQEATTP